MDEKDGTESEPAGPGKRDGPVSQGIWKVVAAIVALGALIAAGSSLLDNMDSLCTNHPAACFWKAGPTICSNSLTLEEYRKCNP